MPPEPDLGAEQRYARRLFGHGRSADSHESRRLAPGGGISELDPVSLDREFGQARDLTRFDRSIERDAGRPGSGTQGGQVVDARRARVVEAARRAPQPGHLEQRLGRHACGAAQAHHSERAVVEPVGSVLTLRH